VRVPLHLARVTRLRGWEAAVAASIVVLATVALAFGIGWLATTETEATTSSVASPVARVELDLSSGSADIVGGSPSNVELRRVDRYAFGRSAHEQKSLSGGVLRVSSSCPRVVIGSCSSSYRVSVPDGVAVSVRTRRGSVRLAGFRGNAQIQTASGRVAVEAFCGFTLSARTTSGGVAVTTACAAKSIDLSSHSGDIVALVPPGRYRVHTTSGSGHARVSGVTVARTAPFSVTLSSGSGDVALEGGL
jgi:hypothetical protein